MRTEPFFPRCQMQTFRLENSRGETAGSTTASSRRLTTWRARTRTRWSCWCWVSDSPRCARPPRRAPRPAVSWLGPSRPGKPAFEGACKDRAEFLLPRFLEAGAPFPAWPQRSFCFPRFLSFLSLFALAPLTLISICSKLYLSLYMLIVEENAIVSSRSSVETTERKDFPGESGSPESPEPSVHRLRNVLAGGGRRRRKGVARERQARAGVPLGGSFLETWKRLSYSPSARIRSLLISS